MKHLLIAAIPLMALPLLGCPATGESHAGTGKAAAASADVQIGDPAPDFSLPGYPDQEFSLARHLGRHAVVLYFYPKDFTPDCVREACAFRDTAAEFAQRGAVIYGISRDELASHALFADEYELPFPLLSDRDGSVRELFGNPGGGRPLIPRITYVIDKQGIVREIVNADAAAELQDHINYALIAVKRITEEAGG